MKNQRMGIGDEPRAHLKNHKVSNFLRAWSGGEPDSRRAYVAYDRPMSVAVVDLVHIVVLSVQGILSPPDVHELAVYGCLCYGQDLVEWTDASAVNMTVKSLLVFLFAGRHVRCAVLIQKPTSQEREII